MKKDYEKLYNKLQSDEVTGLSTGERLMLIRLIQKHLDKADILEQFPNNFVYALTGEPSSTWIDDGEMLRRIDVALTKIDSRVAEMLLLKYKHHMDVKDIANHFSMTTRHANEIMSTGMSVIKRGEGLFVILGREIRKSSKAKLPQVDYNLAAYYKQMLMKDGHEPTSEQVRLMQMPTEILSLSTRAYNSAMRACLTTVGSIYTLGASGFMKIRGVGDGSIEEVRAAFEKYGITWRR